MDLKNMIDGMIAERIEAAIAAALGATNVDAPESNGSGRVVVDASAYRQQRRRARGRAKVAYVANTKARGKVELTPNNAKVYQAIKAAKGPITARELEAKTGLVKKAVESSVWFLRQPPSRLIISKPVAE